MKPLIVALDVDTEQEAMKIVRATKKFVDIYKVGPPLLLKYGTGIIKKIRKAGRRVFLDLKFHDIPNTMARSVKEAAKTGVFSLTVHSSSGEAALKAVSEIRLRPQIWAVTVLTSLSQKDLGELGFSLGTLEQAQRFAEMAARSGVDGVVASVGEAAQLRQVLGRHITIITPGIRMPDDSISDQKRVATPQHARIAGADYIVVGRPILESKNPGQAAEAILRDWKRGG